MWLLTHHLSTVLGFILAILLFSHLMLQRRSPGSEFAWLLLILFVPYLGVPLFLMLGTRKMKITMSREDRLPDAVCANRISFLGTGEKAYREITQAIAGAARSLEIATFILGRDPVGESILSALVDKARSGVKVRLLLDAFGCFWVRRSSLRALRQAGGEIAFFMPLLHVPFRGWSNLRNHRKILIADDCLAIVGGMNLKGEYLGPIPDAKRWRDLSLRIDGPGVAAIARVFRGDWKFATSVEISAGPAPAAALGPDAGCIRVVASGPDVAGDPLYDSFLADVFRARARIWIVTPYFVPDEALTKGLEIAARSGTDVRLCLPLRSNHRVADLARGPSLRRIRAAGGKVLFFAQTMLHAKAVLIDDATAIVASANMDLRSLFLNYEIAVFLRSETEIRELSAWIADLMAQSGEAPLSTTHGREILEGAAGLLSPLL